MSVELSLIRRIIDTHGLQAALEFGISEHDFTDTQANVAWKTIYNYFVDPRTKGSTMALSMFVTLFATIPIRDEYPGEQFKSLCFLVRTNRIRRDVSSMLVDLSSQIALPNADITSAMAMASSRMSQLMALGQVANSDMDSAQGFQRQLQRILDLRAGINRSVAPWPWDPLQRETLGIQQDDFVIFYGRPKQMKSWVLAYLIAFFFQEQIPIVVYTKEMTPDNVYQRVVSCILKQAYQNFRLGNVDEGDFAFIRDSAQAMMSDPLFAQKLIVLSGRDVPAGADTVEWFKSKLEKYQPKIGIVDGLYLLSGTSTSKQQKDNERVQSISRALRGIPLDLGIPIIATNQANRAAAKNRDANLDELAFSDALAQDATLAARVVADKASPTISIIIGGSREFKLHGFRINALPAVDFSFHSELTEEDVAKAQAEDAAAAENKPKKAAKKKKGEGPEPADVEAAIEARVAEATGVDLPS